MTTQKESSFFTLEVKLTFLLWLVYLILPYLVLPERYEYSMVPSELILKISYLFLALFSNFVLIPRFLYRSRYVIFGLLVFLTLTAGAFWEEAVIEYLFFSDARGGEIRLGSLQRAAYKIGFVLVLFSSFKLLWDYQQKQQQMNELEKEKIESELKFLKSQINPHVLFNNLNNIYSYALEKSDKVPDMLLKLSEIMRYMLNESENQAVSLEKEINYLKDFIELQKLRLEERGQVTLNLEGNPEDYKIAPLLLVAFVENSFKHSMRSEIDNIDIRFDLKVSKGKLYFESRNTFSESDGPETIGNNERETGIGLKNVRKRLQLIYGDKRHLDISKKGNYFIVKLTIDLGVHESEMHDY